MIAAVDRPTYSPVLAGRLVNLRPDRVRRWLLGYTYRYAVREELRQGRKEPVVHRGSATGSAYATFLDLVDLLFVKEFLKYGIPLQRLRRALGEAERIVGGHHFAQRSFFTDGSAIYLQVEKAQEADALLELLSGGQWVIAPVIKHTAHQIDFHPVSGFAERWFPLGPDKPVMIDPSVSFGAPTIVGRGIKTANVFDLYLAEGKQTKRVCDWLSLTPTQVGAAVEFECRLAA